MQKSGGGRSGSIPCQDHAGRARLGQRGLREHVAGTGQNASLHTCHGDTHKAHRAYKHDNDLSFTGKYSPA